LVIEYVYPGRDSIEGVSKSSQLSLFYIPMRNKNVSSSEETFLVEYDEKRNYTICGEVFGVSASEGRALEISRTYFSIVDTRMKVGQYHHGFYHSATLKSKRKQCNMGNH